MTEMEYYRMEENAAIGQVLAATAKAIFDKYDATTMAGLQRALYKGTDAGIAISFELFDGTTIFCGDPRASSTDNPWNYVRSIGASSIVEGSDVEVPLHWLDLMKYCDEDDPRNEGELADLQNLACKDFDAICTEVNDEACALWEEAHREDEDDVIT